MDNSDHRLKGGACWLPRQNGTQKPTLHGPPEIAPGRVKSKEDLLVYQSCCCQVASQMHCRIHLGCNSQIFAHSCFKTTHYMKFSIFLNSHETWAFVMKSLAPHQTVLLHSPGCLLALSQTLFCKQPSKISS